VSAESAYWLVAAVAGVFGLLFGSFLNVCIARMPEDRSVVSPGSACPHCGSPVRPYDNVPVLAWLWLRGRCRDCRAPISALYPVVEALFGVLAVLLFRRVVPDLADFDLPHLVAYAWYFWLLLALVGLTFIDLRHQIIPDPFSIYSVPVAIGGAALLGWLGYEGAPTWQQSVVGAAASGGVIVAIMGAYWLIRHEEGMGFGDAKLMALLGGYFGLIPGTLYVLLVGSTVGAVVGVAVALRRKGGLRTALPFGPFLVLGALVWLFFGPQLGRVLDLRLDLLL